ncbi:MAG: FGGY family carbohydrate kinase [Bacteroidales bacterium]|nr:FGGY family carbohydrate kinase [Bacteroidales bacterium]
MQFIGVDLGSSSVKVSVLDASKGKILASAFSPKKEMPIDTPKKGWAEQDPETWYRHFEIALAECSNAESVRPDAIGAIGISYQMHGLVAVDKEHKVIRPAIIWCDSRAVSIGDKAFEGIGLEYCRENLLNSPGNFTASKLAWLKANEPDNYKRIYKIMLPGDYIAMRLTGEISTTLSALSEGIFLDYKSGSLSEELMSYFGFDKNLIPEIKPVFSVQGIVRDSEALRLGLPKGVKVSYRAGDQPNNAASLNVFEPGDIAASAGTSGVIYGVADKIIPDPLFRVNLFAHVNHTPDNLRLGILACVNGTGIMNSWIKKLTGIESYSMMNELAHNIEPGCGGLTLYPFGNGAERLLENKEPGASIRGINLNIHGPGHLCRAVQESIVYSFRYSLEIMEAMGMQARLIRAGKANMFLSPLFGEILASLAKVPIKLYNTDGSMGAARAAAMGCGYYGSMDEAFAGLEVEAHIEPDSSLAGRYNDLYTEWKDGLTEMIK